MTPAAMAKAYARTRPELEIHGTQRTRSRLRRELIEQEKLKRDESLGNVFHPAAKTSRIFHDKSSEFVLPKFAEIQTEEIDHSTTKDFL